MTTVTFTTDSDAAHVAAFTASGNSAAMVAHLHHDHGMPFTHGPASSSPASMKLLLVLHASSHASGHPHTRTAHTCQQGPVCAPWYHSEDPDGGWCEHASCQAVTYSQCSACMDAAMDERGQFDPIFCETHGFTYITDAGSNSGFAGEGFWWANFACGCGTAESGDYS